MREVEEPIINKKGNEYLITTHVWFVPIDKMTVQLDQDALAAFNKRPPTATNLLSALW